jgi:hypothetical protein
LAVIESSLNSNDAAHFHKLILLQYHLFTHPFKHLHQRQEGRQSMFKHMLSAYAELYWHCAELIESYFVLEKQKLPTDSPLYQSLEKITSHGAHVNQVHSTILQMSVDRSKPFIQTLFTFLDAVHEYQQVLLSFIQLVKSQHPATYQSIKQTQMDLRDMQGNHLLGTTPRQ